jgi:flagellar basal-body rod protein FlgB
MFEKLEIFQMAGAMARHAASRQALTAQNIANADTPGYKARDLASFSDTYRDQTGGMEIRATRAGHLSGNSALSSTPRIIAGAGSESPNGNNVSLEGEMMKATEISGHHKRALAIYQSSLGILRTSLGRR